MPYFLFVSLLALMFSACQPKIVPLRTQVLDTAGVEVTVPTFDRKLYQCIVEGKTPLGKKFSLSGLLFFKQMPDESVRLVFQNQMGITYLDFEWTKQGVFSVKQVMKSLDQAPLLKTLQKDFEMLLVRFYDPAQRKWHRDSDQNIRLRYPLGEAWVDYVFEKNELTSIENADDKRVVVRLDLNNVTHNNPLSSQISISHLRANFKIILTEITEDLVP